MRRLILLLALTTATSSTGCIAAVPLLFYAAKNRKAKQASVAVPPAALTSNAVRAASHAEPAAAPHGFIRR